MLRVILVLLFLSGAACASTGAVPRPFPVPAGAPGSPPVVPDNRSPSPPPEPPSPRTNGPRTTDHGLRSPSPQDGYALAGTALSLRGAPYRNGGSDPSGFDCSGFVWYVFSQHRITVPRTVSGQYRAGTDADHALQPGDLVFFSTTAPGPSHVGILIGGDQFVHAPSSKGEVRVERLGASYWAGRYVGARRLY